MICYIKDTEVSEQLTSSQRDPPMRTKRVISDGTPKLLPDITITFPKVAPELGEIPEIWGANFIR